MGIGTDLKQRARVTLSTDKHEEMIMNQLRVLEKLFYPILVSSMVLTSGCIATQDWVQTWVNEKVFPVEKRVSETEAGLTKTNGRVTGLEGQVQTMAKQVADLESQLNQTNAKADQALESLQRLKPERKMVLNFADGARFATNSAQFTAQAKKDIDSFLSDVKGDAADGGSLVYVIAGHSDASGTESYNYQLSKRRAESIAEYLMTERTIEPARVITVGYGERSPVADNKTEAGRARNRRVEIMVYRDSIIVGPPMAASASGKTQR